MEKGNAEKQDKEKKKRKKRPYQCNSLTLIQKTEDQQMRKGKKKLYYFALHILDTLDCDPLGALVTFPLSNEMFFCLTGVEARDNTEGYRWGEWATG